MSFDLDNLNPTTRFYWDEEDVKPDETFKPEEEREWVDFRIVPEEETNRIRGELGMDIKSKFINNPVSKRMERVEDFKLSAKILLEFNDKILDYQIENWHFLTKSGEDIPCNFENKKRMMHGSPIFAGWSVKCIDKLNELIPSIEEAESGN